MAIDVSLASSQANTITGYYNTENGVKTSIASIKGDIALNWEADEMTSINTNIDSIVKDIATSMTELQTLSSDIVTTANEIKQEEVAAKAAADAATAKAAAAKAEADASAANAQMQQQKTLQIQRQQ